MPAEVIACPACANQVRVPETLLGQAVRCPKCKAYFTAPTRDASGNLGTPELLENPPAYSGQAVVGPPPTLDRSPLLIPAMLLVFVGFLGLVVNGGLALWLTFGIDRIVEQAKKAAEDPKHEMHKVNGGQVSPDDIKAENFILVRNLSWIFFGVGVLICIGALSMFAGRFFGLAVLGSGLAVINLWLLCCLLSAPVGIYSLIKLFDPDIRPLFSRR